VPRSEFAGISLTQDLCIHSIKSQVCPPLLYSSIYAYAYATISDLRRAPHPYIVLYVLLLTIELYELGSCLEFDLTVPRKDDVALSTDS
jgi:hypothetical protein